MTLALGLLPGAAHAATTPSGPEKVRFSFAQSTATVTWVAGQPNPGQEAVVGYDVLLRRDGGGLEVHRVAGTTFSFALNPGRGVHGNVRAVTESTAGSTTDGAWRGSGNVGLIAALDANHRAVYKLADEGSWTSLGDLTFVNGISVGKSYNPFTVVVAADGLRRLWARTLRGAWQQLGTQRCRQPVVSAVQFTSQFVVACLDDSGRLVWSTLEKGLRDETLTLGGWVVTSQKPQGRFAMVDGEAFFRVAQADANGRNAFSWMLANNEGRRLPLRCTGDVGAGESTEYQSVDGGGYGRGDVWVACADGPRTVRYLRSSAPVTWTKRYDAVGAALSPVDLLGRPSVWESGKVGLAQIGFVVGNGLVHEYDVDAGRWHTISGQAVLPGISGVPWVG